MHDTTLWTLGLITLCTTANLQADSPGQLNLTVREPAGIHRDGSPVHIRLNLPKAVPTDTPFRLLRDGQPQFAQFRPAGKGSSTASWWLDFVAPSAPRQTNAYVVEYGPDVEPGPERKRGHQLTVRDDAFVVSNAPYIDWTVPRDLVGFLRSVDFAPAEHLRPDSPGLTLQDRDGRTHVLGGSGTQATVVRQGRMTVALRFEKAETHPSLRGVRWTADLVFPGPVSWVDLQLRIDDPQDRLRAVGMRLNLNLDPPTGRERTLVELGGSRMVYRSLFNDQRVRLEAGQGGRMWQVLCGTDRSLEPFAVADPDSPPAEGWAHIMDRKRCLAIAFDKFGRTTDDSIEVSADGRFQAVRDFSTPDASAASTMKTWRSWLHFVHFPPAQSAATDPYMMQNPLQVHQVSP